jgi:hypothetical protein
VNNSMSSVLDPYVSCDLRPHVSHRVFFRNPREYLHHVMKATNMSCLTPEGATSGECDFLSANMYARSLFGKSFGVSSLRKMNSYSFSLFRRRCFSQSKH